MIDFATIKTRNVNSRRISYLDRTPA